MDFPSAIDDTRVLPLGEAGSRHSFRPDFYDQTSNQQAGTRPGAGQ